MYNLKNLGSIKFIDIPQGEISENVRKMWIGVEIPCLYLDPENSTSYGLISGKTLVKHPRYIVPQGMALDALRKKGPERAVAADYWNHLGYPADQYAVFSFNIESAEVIKPILSKEEFLNLSLFDMFLL